jgi:hypothetical protein
MTQSNFPENFKPVRRLAADYVPASKADARAYACFVMENFEPFDWPPPTRRRKRRGLSLARAIRQARKAGVDVTVAPDGTITLRFGEQTTTSTTANELDQWMAKHAH